jgi:hypothetical protein
VNSELGRSWRDVVSPHQRACSGICLHGLKESSVSAEIRTGHFFNSLKPVVTVYTTCINMLKLWVIPTECICMLRMVLTINSDFFPKQH